MDRVWPLTEKTSLPSIAVPPFTLEAVGPFGTVDLARRAMYRSSPTEGSAVVLEVRVASQYGELHEEVRMRQLLGCHMN